jgi:hypothetical protein
LPKSTSIYGGCTVQVLRNEIVSGASHQLRARESPQEKTRKVSKRQSLSPAVMIDFDGRNILRLV